MRDLKPQDTFSSSIQVFAHASLSQEATQVKALLEQHQLEQHIAVFSSGTTSSLLKGYALSYEALKANARAVNEFYKLSKDDVWALSLPDYHIGGLSVLMRAMLLGNRVVDARGWDPVVWQKTILENKVTVTTIVPTQLYDLVKNKLKAPADLKLLIVGGDYLSFDLQKRAEELGWPVRRTFGMTEVASQLASSSKGTTLEVLPIHQVKTDQEGRLWVKTPSLFTFQFQLSPDIHIKWLKECCDNQGYYQTQDRVKLEGQSITPMGRMDEQIKVAGHMTHLPALRETLYQLLLKTNHYGEAEIHIQPDERKGHRLILLHQESLPGSLIEDIRKSLLPYPLDEMRPVKSIDRTDLGKLKKH